MLTKLGGGGGGQNRSQITITKVGRIALKQQTCGEGWYSITKNFKNAVETYSGTFYNYLKWKVQTNFGALFFWPLVENDRLHVQLLKIVNYSEI